MSYFADAGSILIEVLFALVTALFVLRVLLQTVRANFHNPVCQFFYRATNPVLMPLRRVLPPWRGFDVAGSIVAWLLQCLKIFLLFALAGVALNLPATLLLGAVELLSFLLSLYFGLILVRVILSFFGQGSYHPMVPLIVQLSEPVLRPLRRLLPTPAGLDLSPLVATLIILLARALVVAPLRDLGLLLAKS